MGVEVEKIVQTCAYIITEQESGKYYAGSTSSGVVKRVREHISYLRSGKHVNKNMQELFDQGFYDWEVEYVETPTLQEAKEVEGELLRRIGKDPKILNIANNPNGGIGSLSDETMAKHRNKVVTEKTKMKMSASAKLRCVSDSHISELANAKKKKVTVHSVHYDSVREAAVAHGIDHRVASYRLSSNNPKWANWNYT